VNPLIKIINIVALLLVPVIGGPADTSAKPHAGAAPMAVAVAPAPAAAMPGAAKIYFDTGAAAVPADTAAMLAPVVAWAKTTPAGKLSISGFHDSTGSPEQNAELAKNRAVMVQDALVAAGVPADRLVLQKPQQMDAGDGREARRVEVTPTL
jgi:K(+)-stimulated pyrophosphate-energized sodium pump